ncbi:MAG TPA: thioredoxin domain-containing protein [Deinococcales bacterium]|nr:thioredoxin domain-containing protein [Deinococcales bacterium]
MNQGARNLFLGLLALIAVVGVVAIVFLTRAPAPSGGTNAAAGPVRKLSYTTGGSPQQLDATPITGDPSVGGRYSLGKADAPLVVTEFANYQCIHCKNFSEETFPAFQTEFVDSGKARFVYRDLPFNGQENVHRASEAAACAADQGRYWDYHNALYRASDQWVNLTGSGLDTQLAQYATDIGLDGAGLQSCLSSNRYTAAVDADIAAATKFGVDGTPAFFINGYRYEGEMRIEALRAALTGPGPQ